MRGLGPEFTLKQMEYSWQDDRYTFNYSETNPTVPFIGGDGEFSVEA